MNVLYIFCSLDVGGAQKVSVATALAMKERGHQVYVAAPPGHLASDLLRHDVAYTALDIRPDRENLAAFVGVFLRILTLTRRHDIDVIHTNHRWATLIAFFVSSLSKARIVWTDHSLLTGKKHLTLHKDKVISISHFNMKHLVDYFGVPRDKIAVIHNGVRQTPRPNNAEVRSFLLSLPICGRPPIACTVGRLEEEKGHRYLLQAIPRVLGEIPDAQFLFAGDGTRRDHLVSLARRLGIHEHVHFLGDRPDVPIILAASSMMVLPSLSEGISLALLEALASGRPVVVTNVGGNPEVVRHEVTGLIVAPRDPQGLAEAICTLFSGDKVREEMGREAVELVRREFDFDDMITKIEAVYRDCNENGRSRITVPGDHHRNVAGTSTIPEGER